MKGVIVVPVGDPHAHFRATELADVIRGVAEGLGDRVVAGTTTGEKPTGQTDWVVRIAARHEPMPQPPWWRNLPQLVLAWTRDSPTAAAEFEAFRVQLPAAVAPTDEVASADMLAGRLLDSLGDLLYRQGGDLFDLLVNTLGQLDAAERRIELLEHELAVLRAAPTERDQRVRRAVFAGTAAGVVALVSGIGGGFSGGPGGDLGGAGVVAPQGGPRGGRPGGVAESAAEVAELAADLWGVTRN